MLSAAEKYEKAFQRYYNEDPYYKLELEKDGVGVPKKSDWERVSKMAEFLERQSTQHLTTSSMRLQMFWSCCKTGAIVKIDCVKKWVRGC
jgi:tRNA 2-selenouridine synthase SelU